MNTSRNGSSDGRSNAHGGPPIEVVEVQGSTHEEPSAELLADPSAGADPMTTEEKRLLTKPREGFIDQAPGVIKIAETFPRQVGTDPSPSQLHADLARAKEARRKEEAAAKVLKVAAGERLAAESVLWGAMLEIYSRTKNSRNAAIRRAAAPFMNFMKVGPRAATAKDTKAAGEKPEPTGK